MYEALFVLRQLLFLYALGIIKTWSFGGFGLDKTYVLLFFQGLAQFLVNLVYLLGLFNLDGGRMLLHVSILRSLGQMFAEPLLAAIIGDFAVRLSILRNERALANKL